MRWSGLLLTTSTSPARSTIDSTVKPSLRCWPGGDAIAAIDIQRLLPQNDECAFVSYEITMKDGRRFRNRFIATRDGKLRDVEVYFGWNIPHDAKLGGFVDKQK